MLRANVALRSVALGMGPKSRVHDALFAVKL